MSELHTRMKLKSWTVNQMRDCIVEVVELLDNLNHPYGHHMADGFLRKWKLEEEE